MKKIEVVAAIIKHGNEILCTQRPENKLQYISKKFEFPGGKIEAGETKEEALIRELSEELNLTTVINSPFITVVHEYPDFEITMHSFICEVDSKNITLTEHIDSKWMTLENIESLDWAAADIPIVNKLISNG
ncbi:(deoxy)nucleoside triphosphate pyrophosphohydrolase [Flavihumibacter sp. UBA7668]|uniref:(deoxy)nucleoside triphosphate pyrophosphohydrolase n=1 Tax=Flavihumibacter sp. UBA7668 TaxID=1946542 RepID=UPI0025B9FD2D|nr:(deoxy)nucleoside triphosphate pyrophosphohydrolase [Flavihumibacter sp. UBA7668]